MVGGMPKEKISDDVSSGWYTEVSWRRPEHACPCGTSMYPVESGMPTYCPECNRPNMPIVSGHLQLGTVNPGSEFVFPANPNAPDEEPAEPFDGWRVTLDADQIDYLITVLRKARRQAFPDHHSAQAGGFSYSGSATFAAESRTFPHAV